MGGPSSKRVFNEGDPALSFLYHTYLPCAPQNGSWYFAHQLVVASSSQTTKYALNTNDMDIFIGNVSINRLTKMIAYWYSISIKYTCIYYKVFDLWSEADNISVSS